MYALSQDFIAAQQQQQTPLLGSNSIPGAKTLPSFLIARHYAML
jgi:hypothetical protein